MGSGSGKAIVREAIEQMDGVSRVWFEWHSDGDHLERVLIVEIESDTDPEGATFNPHTIRFIDEEVARVLRERTTMIVTGLRIVPKHR